MEPLLEAEVAAAASEDLEAAARRSRASALRLALFFLDFFLLLFLLLKKGYERNLVHWNQNVKTKGEHFESVRWIPYLFRLLKLV